MDTTSLEKVKLVKKGAWIGILGNLGIALLKLFIGLWAHSIAVIADALHSFEDLISSLVLLLGFGIVAKPPDKEHPYGHGRAQEIVGFINSLILLIAAFQIGLYSVKKIIRPKPVDISVILLLVLLMTVLLKEAMARYTLLLAKKSGSMALRVDSWHHRLDALSSLVIVIALVGMSFGIYALDGIFGLILAIWIAWFAISWLRKASSSLLGEAPPDDLVRAIEEIVKDINGAYHAHRIRIHTYGFHKEVTLHLQVEPSTNLFDAHKIATAVEERIKEKIGGEVTVHVEPIGDEFEKGA